MHRSVVVVVVAVVGGLEVVAGLDVVDGGLEVVVVVVVVPQTFLRTLITSPLASVSQTNCVQESVVAIGGTYVVVAAGFSFSSFLPFSSCSCWKKSLSLPSLNWATSSRMASEARMAVAATRNRLRDFMVG